MKILLHMGQGKTGTTALQQSLHAASSRLRGKGVLYPAFGHRSIAHHLLLPLCENPDRLTRWSLECLSGPEAAVEAAWQAWNHTCDQVREDPPGIMVLSSELLIFGTGERAKARLAETLSELSADIIPVLYIRHPVDDFRARLQEALKFDDGPFPPVGLNLRKAISDTEAAFSARPQLVAFDRATLHGGDIASDFATRFLGGWLSSTDLPRRVANVGLSAEALVLLCRLRTGSGHMIAPGISRAQLLRPVAELDRLDPPDRPLTLYPEVAEAALRTATGHRWLVETGRLQIPGLDVTGIDGRPVPDWMKTAPPDTLFPHDPARLERLHHALRVAHPELLA